MLAPEIFTGARHSPRLANAHHKPGRGSPQNFKSKYQKLGLKFITLALVEVTSQNFSLPGDYLEAGVITLSLILEGVPPTKFERAKNVQNSTRFLSTCTHL